MQLNGHRCIEGTLRGYDQFINLTLADAVDKTVTGTSAASNRDLGMVVRLLPLLDWTCSLCAMSRVCAFLPGPSVVPFFARYFCSPAYSFPALAAFLPTSAQLF